MSSTVSFPKEFVWGAATSSYQIEGAVNADGRGESIWDRFCSVPGNIADGTNGNIACDHYNLWQSDIAVMRQLNLGAYRFSIAWPRILPAGRGAVSQAGLDFYSRLVDGLLAANITPYITLYHWDLPQALEDAGGWPERHVVDAFVEYTDVVTRHLGDRVKSWTTFNEPAVSSWVGYWMGRHAPGRKDAQAAAQAAHHILLAHGKAVPVIRSNVPDTQVGIVVDIIPYTPASSSATDRIATQVEDGRQNRWFLDPLANKPYPSEVVEHFELDMTHVAADDIAAIATPVDFVGINYYRRNIIRGDEAGNAPQTEFYGEDITAMDWEVRASSLYDAMKMVNDYGLSDQIFITENGAAYDDDEVVETPDGVRVRDPRRENYYRTHLATCARAVADGIPLKGYFAWSLFDNFEWGYGYTKRFGIVRVDYDTQRRTIKDSGRFYASVIANGGFELD